MINYPKFKVLITQERIVNNSQVKWFNHQKTQERSKRSLAVPLMTIIFKLACSSEFFKTVQIIFFSFSKNEALEFSKRILKSQMGFQKQEKSTLRFRLILYRM